MLALSMMDTMLTFEDGVDLKQTQILDFLSVGKTQAPHERTGYHTNAKISGRLLRRRKRKRKGTISSFVSLFNCVLRQYHIPLHMKEILLIIFALWFPRVHCLVERTAFPF